MKTENLIKVCGSITKTESLVPIVHNIIENSWIMEANLPYANYYGQVPQKAKPNSIFFGTTRFYTLEEVLRFAQNIGFCLTVQSNIASAIFTIGKVQFPAIRLKNFPDYEHLKNVQNCFINEGVEFAAKIPYPKEASVQISKCFILEQLEENIYMDKVEENEGYFVIPRQLKTDDFNDLLKGIRNNSDCKLFDAAQGGLIINNHVTDIVRIYAEGIDLALLKCIKNLFQKMAVSMYS